MQGPAFKFYFIPICLGEEGYGIWIELSVGY
jgi:hypothetical protein